MIKTYGIPSPVKTPVHGKDSTTGKGKIEQIERSYKKAFGALFLVILALLLAYALCTYINAFFGALILYVVFRPLYRFLTIRMKVRSGLAALGVMIITVLVVLIPLYTIFTIVITEIQQMIADVESMDQFIPLLEDISVYSTRSIGNIVPSGIDLQESITELVDSIVSALSTMLISIAQSAGKRLLEFVMMYFLLFYMFVGEGSDFACSLKNAVPFNRDNTGKLLNEFISTIRTLLISTGAIALIQGTLLTITFILSGIEGAFLWGFVTFIISFIPAMGTPFIWIPAAIIQLLQQDYFSAAGVCAGGFLVSSSDNIMRPLINKRVGQLHPLISLIGVIAGLKLFGLLGIIIGPLLVSYTLLIARMFHEEYL